MRTQLTALVLLGLVAWIWLSRDSDRRSNTVDATVSVMSSAKNALAGLERAAGAVLGPAKQVLGTLSGKSPNAMVASANQVQDDEAKFAQQFHSEVQRIAQIDLDPAQTETRLRKLAESLNPEQAKWLAGQALDLNVDGDQRAMAVQLLAWSGHEANMALLEKIALAPIAANTQDSHIIATELVYRSQAIEGLAHTGSIDTRRQALQRLVNSLDNKVLLERTERSLVAVNNGDPDAVERQDRKALSQLLEK